MVTAIVTWALIGLSAALQVLYIIMYRKRSHTDHELLARVDHKMDALNARTDELSAKTDALNAKTDMLHTKTDILHEKVDVLQARHTDRQTGILPHKKDLMATLTHKMETVAQICAENNKNLSRFKNSCQGKTVVLCGAGGTLNFYDPIKGAVHFGISRAFLQDKLRFDYLYMGDWRGIDHIQDELCAYKGNNCVKFFFNGSPTDPTSIIPESYIIECGGTRVYTNAVLYDTFEEVYTNSRFALDPSTMPVGNFGNSALPSMQLILYMNPRKIYIVGVDYRGQHFHKGGRTDDQERMVSQEGEDGWNRDGEMESVLFSHWVRLKEFASVHYPDTEIISLNPLGLKGLFTDEYTGKFLEATRQEGWTGGWVSAAE